MRLPNTPGEISKDYLASMLRVYTGRDDLAVADFSVQRLEKGTSGSKLYWILIRTTDGEQRRFVLKMEGGQGEVLFYRDLASRLDVDTPRVLDAHILDDGREWVIMEEIADVKDGLAWDERDYRAVLKGMARLHGQFWGRTELLDDCEWLWRPTGEALEALVAKRRIDAEVLMTSDVPRVLPDVFGADRVALMQRVLAEPDRVFGPLLAVGTGLVHGDYWFHNVQVMSSGRVVLMDWQEPQVWSGAWELAYFMNLLLVVGPGEYRETLPFSERQMVGWYREGMSEVGVDVPQIEFEAALTAARVWHPLQHWLRQYSYVVKNNLVRLEGVREQDPGAIRFLAATFDRWDEDVHLLLGL